MADVSSLVERALSVECGTAPVTREFLDPSTREQLAAVAQDATEPMVRRGRAVFLLGLWRDDETASMIDRVVDDLDDAGRIAAASALGRVGTSRAVRSLERLSRDHSPDVRRVAVNGLGDARTDAARAVLRRVAADDPSEINRARATELLE